MDDATLKNLLMADVPASDPPFAVVVMKRIEQRDRRLHRRLRRIGQFGPRRFFVRLDRRVVLRQRELEAGIGVQVTVGHVMDDLPHRPAFRTIRRVELRVGQPGHRGAKLRRSFGNGVDRGASLFWFERLRPLETAHRISKIFHGGLR